MCSLLLLSAIDCTVELPIILSRIWQLISPPFFGSASPCQWQTHTRVPRQLWKKNLTTRNLSCARGNVEIDPSDLASLSDACESSLRTRDMSEKYLRHRQSFNLSHFLAPNLRLYFDCDFGFGFASVHWRQVHRSYDFPLTEVCATCVCVCVSHVCAGRVAYREITFIIGTQPAKRNCQIEKRKPNKK